MVLFVLAVLFLSFWPFSFSIQGLVILSLYLLFSTSLWFYSNKKENKCLLSKYSRYSIGLTLLICLIYSQVLLYQLKIVQVQQFQSQQNQHHLYTFKLMQPVIYQKQNRFLIKITKVNNQRLPWYQQPKLWLYQNQMNSHSFYSNQATLKIAPIFKVGQHYQGHLTIKQPHSKRNDAGFDAELAALADYTQGTASLPFSKNSLLRLLDVSDYIGIRPWQQNYYNKVISWIENKKEKGLLSAFAFADRLQLTDDDWQLFRSLGLSHLLAISGLHIGLAMSSGWILALLFRSLFFMFEMIARQCLTQAIIWKLIPIRSRWYGLPLWLKPNYVYCKSLLHLLSLWSPMCLGLFFAFGYAWLAGFSLPTLRALISCLFMSGLLICGYQLAHWRLWCYTLCFYLLLDPFAPFQVSFWLSFGAVVILACYFSYQKHHYHFNTLLTEHVRHQMTLKSGIQQLCPKVKQLIILQGLLCLAMLPIQSYFFYGVSLMAPIVNLLVIPYVSLLSVPLILFALFCALFDNSLFNYLGQLLFHWADMSLQLMRQVLLFFPDYWLSISQSQWLYYVVLVMAIGYYFIGLSKSFAFGTFILLVLQLSFFDIKAEIETNIDSQKVNDQSLAQQRWQLSVVDVDQGLSILIEKQGRAVIYDTGISWTGGSMAQSVLAPMLQKRGISKLDGLILSHADNDHAGGHKYLEQNFEPLWRRSSDIRPHYLQCKQGVYWYWQGLTFQVLSPMKMTKRASNNDSCVILIKTNNISILLTGDIEAKPEIYLTYYLRQLGLNKIDILIVPHHGSATSSTETLLKQINPTLAIASVGRFNRFRHPSAQVVARYQKLKIPFLTTAQEGQITIDVNATGWRILKKREQDRNRWYRQMFY